MIAATEEQGSLGWCCSDCLMWLANGETPLELDEDETQAWKENLWRETAGFEVTLGMLRGEVYWCECTEDQLYDGTHAMCEQMDFSWSRCDVCGSRLGGAREAVTFWRARYGPGF